MLACDQVIPPYNAQLDRSVKPYFSFDGVWRTLNLTGQVNGYVMYLTAPLTDYPGNFETTVALKKTMVMPLPVEGV